MEKETLKRAKKLEEQINDLKNHLKALNHYVEVSGTDNVNISLTVKNHGGTFYLNSDFFTVGINDFIAEYKKNLTNKVSVLEQEFQIL
jgi:hypothetical protein